MYFEPKLLLVGAVGICIGFALLIMTIRDANKATILLSTILIICVTMVVITATLCRDEYIVEGELCDKFITGTSGTIVINDIPYTINVNEYTKLRVGDNVKIKAITDNLVHAHTVSEVISYPRHAINCNTTGVC